MVLMCFASLVVSNLLVVHVVGFHCATVNGKIHIPSFVYHVSFNCNHFNQQF